MTGRKRFKQPENWAALDGYADALARFARTGDPAEFKATLISHENMAECLHAIAWGEDAGEVFRQSGRPGRQKLGWYQLTLTTVYWLHRINSPTDHKGAIRAALNHGREKFPNIKAPESTTLARYARRDQALTLDRFDDQPKVEPLRKLLAKKSKKSPRGSPTR